MALSDILGALTDQLRDIVKLEDGPEHLVERSAPSIVAIPGDEGYVDPETHWTTEWRALTQRNADVEFHILGRDRSASEQLITALVNAIRAEVGTSCRIARGEWERRDAKAVTAHGRPYVLFVTFFVPVLEAEPRMATVSETEQDVDLEPVQAGG